MIFDSIILTSDQAAYVRGNEYQNGSQLMPRLVDNKAAMSEAGAPYDMWAGKDQFYFLAARIITNPDFASVSGYLSAVYASMPGPTPHLLETDTLFLPPPEDE